MNFKSHYTKTFLSLFVCISCGFNKPQTSESRINALSYGTPHNKSQFEIYSELLDEEERKIQEAQYKSKKYNSFFMLELHKDIKKWFEICQPQERDFVFQLLERSSLIRKKLMELGLTQDAQKIGFSSQFIKDSIIQILSHAKESGTSHLSSKETVVFAMEVLGQINDLLHLGSLANQEKNIFEIYAYYAVVVEQILKKSQSFHPQFCLTILLQVVKPLLEQCRLTLEMELLNKYFYPSYTSPGLTSLEGMLSTLGSLLTATSPQSLTVHEDSVSEIAEFFHILTTNRSAIKSILENALPQVQDDPNSYLRVQYEFVSSSIEQMQSQMKGLIEPPLTAHLTYERLAKALDTLETYTKEAQSELDKHLRERKEATHSTLEILKHKMHKSHTQTEEAFLVDEIKFQENLVNSLQHQIAYGEAHFAQFHHQFLDHFSHPSWINAHGKSLSTQSQETYVVSSKEVKRQINSNQITDIAIERFQKTVKIPLVSGETLSTQVTGQWKANGLFKKHRIYNPDLQKIPDAELESISFGPEGFPELKAFGFSYYSSFDHTKSSYTRTESTTSQSASLNVGHSVGPLSASGGVSQSSSKTSGTEDRRSQTEGQRSDVSRQYHIAGLRLPDAPIPQMPVGSFVKVVLPKGKLSVDEALFIDIVRPSDVYVAQEDCDVYFVINDDGTGTPSELHVQTHVLQTLNDQLKEFQNALLQELTFLLNHKTEIINSGHFSSQAAVKLKQTVLSRLALSNAYINNRIVQEFAHKWVDNEISLLENCSQIKKAKSHLASSKARLQALKANQGLQEHVDTLNKRVFLEDLKNLNKAPLSAAVLRLVRHQAHVVAPMLKILNPLVFENFRRKLDTSSFNFNSPLTTQAQVVIETTWKFLETVRSHAWQEISEKRKTVALSFPLSKDAFSESDWNIVPEWLSSQLWQAISHVYSGSGSTQVQFTITPDLLYKGTSGLSKHFNFPLVTKMGVGLVGRDVSENSIKVFNAGHLKLEMKRGPKYEMPNFLTNKMVSYFKPETTDIDLPMVWGSSTEVMTFVQSILPESTAEGESPFTTYTIDFAPFKESAAFQKAISRSHTFVLFFEIMGRPGRSQ